MRRAAVIHHTLNSPGGEATVAIETINLLHEIGYEVSLITVQKPDLERIAQAYGKEIPVSDVHSLIPFKMHYLGIYQRLLLSAASFSRAIKEANNLDLIINTNGDVVVPSSYAGDFKGIPHILYFHFPAALMTTPGYGNSKYQNSRFWKAYFKPYQLASRQLGKKAIANSDIVLTNSQFSRRAIMEAYPGVAVDDGIHVLYPPVDVDRFLPAYRGAAPSKAHQVLVISRFSPEKRIENAIKIASMLPDFVKFVIVGSLLPANQPYFASIQKMANELGLSKRITLIPNATNEQLISAMSGSSVYLHTMVGDHFGISIIEAMAAGLVPIVPSYGGCAEIFPAYHYTTLEEAAHQIAQNINNTDSGEAKKRREAIRSIAVSRYSVAQFKKGMKNYIEQAIAARRVKPASGAAAAG